MAPAPQPTLLRVAHLNPQKPQDFDLRPDADARAALAAQLGISGLPALRMRGSVRAEGGDAWTVTGQLTARVVQPCVVSLAPVTTAINESLRRVFSPHVRVPDGDDIEMPDDEIEPLGQFIDLAAIMTEALALALPMYPRADNAADLPEPEPADEDRQRPFAGLADLLRKDDQ